MKKILLMGGKINSGKNFCYETIKEFHPNTARAYFAKDLKDTCKDVFKRYSNHINSVIEDTCLFLSSINDDKNEHAINMLQDLIINDHNWYEDKTDSTRIILQTVGTDIVKNKIDPKYWAKQTAKHIQSMDKDLVVITDFRYPEEYESLKEILGTEDYKFFPVNIIRNVDKESNGINEHASENSLASFDEWFKVIDNNGTIDETKTIIKELLTLIEKN